jgi:hypothetical protein
VNDQMTFGAVASSVLGSIGTGETAVLRRTAPVCPTRLRQLGVIAGPVVGAVQGTSLSNAGVRAHLGATDAVMTDQVQGTAVRIPAAAAKGIPPRRTPPRC